MSHEERPAKLPEWATGPGPPNPDVEEPPAGKVDEGWVAGERPPHDWFNFLIKNPADWIRYLEEAQASLGSLNWERTVGDGSDGSFEDGAAATVDQRGGDFDPISKYWLSAGNTDGCQITKDDGRNWTEFDGGMASGVGLQDCAIGATSSAVCVGGSATMYQRATILSGTWGTVTAPGSPTFLASIVYDTLNTRHVMVGNESGNEPYVATANNDTGTAFTDRSGNVPAGFDALGLNSLAVNDTGVVVAGTFDAHTKLARSIDGGINWTESSTTLVSGIYNVTWSVERKLFVAVRVDSHSSNNTYTSADGNVWTSVFTGAIGFDGTPTVHHGHAVVALGPVILVGGEFGGVAVVGVSFDAGATWSVHPVEDLATGPDTRLVASRSGGKVIAFTASAFGARSTRRAAG